MTSVNHDDADGLAARADEILAARALLADQATRGAVRMYDRMAGAILRHGLSLSELADLSGIAHHHLTAVLDGDDELSVTELLLVAGVLSVDAAAWFAQPTTAGGDQ